jgi:hypothetical protein
VETEAKAFARHLLAVRVPPSLVDRYARALEAHGLLDSLGRDPLRPALLYRSVILPLVDAGLARCEPAAPFRRRFLLFAALAETDPRTAASFLPHNYYLVPTAIAVGYHGLYALATAFLGRALLLLLRYRPQ